MILLNVTFVEGLGRSNTPIGHCCRLLEVKVGIHSFPFLEWDAGNFCVWSMERCTLQILNKRSVHPGSLSVLALPDFGLDSKMDACSLYALGAWKYAV